MRSWSAAIPTALLIAGCASSYSPEARTVTEAHKSEVKNCEHLGPVQGSASGFHWSESEAMQSARNRALEQAHGMEASHVVWQHIEEDRTPRVQGEAYQC